MNKYCTVLLFCLLSNLVWAQNSNELGIFTTSYPESGNWFANDDSRTGFYFDIQNGTLASTYFGYDNSGDAVWFIFSGALQPLFDLTNPDIQVGWQLETDLLRFENGGCIIDCENATPANSSFDIVGQITIQFEGRSQGRFFIDDNEVTDILPLYFGTSAIISDTGAGLTAQPRLEGRWLIALNSADFEAGNATVNPVDQSGIIEIGPQEVIPETDPEQIAAGVLMTTVQPITSDTSGFFPDDASVDCTHTTSTISCLVNGGDFNIFSPIGGLFVSAPIQQMTDSRFIIFLNAVSDGISSRSTITRVEAFRLQYD